MTDILIEEGVSGSNLETILDELRYEQCAHSWGSFIPENGGMVDAVESLVAWERRKRPTTFFSYYAVNGAGERDLIGMGTVAEKISHRFPYGGFPVIARCYIRRRYRGLGLYFSLLRHRFDFCCHRWGAGLKAIHLSSADARVVRTASSPALLPQPFRRICLEELLVRSRRLTVHAFLSFTDEYARTLRDAAARVGGDPLDPDCPRALLGRALQGLVDGDDEFDLFDVEAIWQLASLFGVEQDPTLDQLLALCREFTPSPYRTERRT